MDSAWRLVHKRRKFESDSVLDWRPDWASVIAVEVDWCVIDDRESRVL